MTLKQIPSRSISPTGHRRIRNSAPGYEYMSRNDTSRSKISEASRHNFSATELDRLRSQMQSLHASITDLQEAVGKSKTGLKYGSKKPNSCNLATFSSQKLLWDGGAAKSLDGMINQHRRRKLQNKDNDSSSDCDAPNSDYETEEAMDDRFEIEGSSRLSPVKETDSYYNMSPQTMPDIKGYHCHDFRTFGVHSLHAVSDNEYEVGYEAAHENNVTEDELEIPATLPRKKDLEEEISNIRHECEEKSKCIKLLESSKINLQAKISQLEQKNITAQKSNANLIVEKESLEDSIKKITRDIAVLRQVASDLSDELEMERKKSADGVKELQKLQLQNLNLRTILSKLRNYKKCVKCKSPNTGLHSSSESTTASSKDMGPEPQISATSLPQIPTRKGTQSKTSLETSQLHKSNLIHALDPKEASDLQPVVAKASQSPSPSQTNFRNPSPLFLPRDIRAASPPKIIAIPTSTSRGTLRGIEDISKSNIRQTQQEGVTSSQQNNNEPLHFSVLPVHATSTYQPVTDDEVDVAVAHFTNSRCNKIILTRARKNSYLFGRLPIKVYLNETRPHTLLVHYKGCSFSLLKFVELHEDSEYHYFTKTLSPAKPSSPRLTGISRPSSKDNFKPVGAPSMRTKTIENLPEINQSLFGKSIAPRARRQAHRFGSSGSVSTLSRYHPQV
eukprot:GHVP01015663.1.p1 GENE.GHVP01015663.1~~GHVP01015663.1.p1  ORF type:complete len:674 (+),score=112.42 GHVP01015663.1:921-2942(+)